MNEQLAAQFGNIDIYLFDQLLKGRFDGCKRIIDIGCGGGRNIVYFLQQGFEVFGIDQDPGAVSRVQQLAAKLAPTIPTANFAVAKVEELPFESATFDLAICSAVLHFAKDKNHFEAMLQSIWRVLRPGGFLFARLASDIGIEALVQPLGNNRYVLPDGSERYLVTEHDLLHYTKTLNAELFEPLKTTNVSNLRAMTTWCLRKL